MSEAIRGITTEIKDDTAAIRTTGEHHTSELATLKTEAHKQTALSSAILQDTSQIPALRADASSSEEAKLKAHVLEWLSQHDHSNKQHDNISQYKEGTGMWLLDDVKFKEWRDGTHNTLFCVGMPGAGKTVMSAMVIRHLFECSRIPGEQVAVSFLYFRYDLRDSQSSKALIGSLVRQLVNQVAKIPDFIERAFKTRFDHQYGSQSLQDMLQAAANCFSRVYFVIDGLDEGSASHAKDLISAIRSLKKGGIKLFSTSRFIPEIQEQFKEDPSIEIRGSESDIRSYATGRITELPRCAQTSPTLQAEIVQAIVTSTQGMFLLAKLHIDSLKDKRTVKAMRSTLRILPSGSSAYDTAYAWAMKRISDQSQSDYKLAQEVLTWLLYAMRPISAIDVETALAVELGARNLDPDNVVTIVELLSLCAGLVIQDEESKTVRFVHYTTQEYFSRNPEHLLRNPHRILSDICVSYLGIDDFMAAGYREDADNQRLSSHIHRYPFLKYAAAHWEDHAKAALPFTNDDEKSQTSALELRLLRHHELMESYFRARGQWHSEYYTLLEVHEFKFERKTGMQYAAARGNFEQVSILLKAGLDPNDSRYGTTALIEAAQGHHESVLRLLIEAKANVNFQAMDSAHTALTIALGMEARWINLSLSRSSQEENHPEPRAHEPTVSLLLDAGADPEHGTQDCENLTPLMHASKHGMETIVARLCKAGADVNRRGGDDMCNNGGQTALHVAASNGHEGIVQQLLQLGCDPDPVDNCDQSPAAYAAEGEHWMAVQFLLGADTVDFGRKTSDGDTILELACRSKDCPDALIQRLLQLTSPGCLNVSGRPLICAAGANKESAVKMLLEAGADPNLTDQKGDTALHAVARLDSPNSEHVSIAITQALLGANVDIDTRGCDGVTALMMASRTGQSELLGVLLEQGADTLSRDTRGRTALTYAAQKGHATVIRRLISAGADVNVASESGTTPLMSAAERGSLDAAAILIEAGAEVNAQAPNGASAVIISCSWGYKDLTRLLVDSGADVNLANEEGETALISMMRAEIDQIERGELELGILDLLPVFLEAGVDVNHATDDGDTALLLATDPKYPRPNDAMLLLEAGADPSVYGIVSWRTISKMDLKLLETVLNAGADPNESNDDGMTALMRVSCAGNQLGKMKALLCNGAKPDIVNNKGETALTLAVNKLHSDLSTKTVKVLLKAGANPNHEDAQVKSVLFHLVSRNYRKKTKKWEWVFKTLIEAGGNIEAINKNQETLLMRSLRRPGMTKFLLAAGASPQGLDKDGRNTVMLASMIARDDGAEAVRLLLDSGVDPNQRDCNGKNALMLAARSYSSPMIFQMLLSAGADPHERDANGLTMLMLVASNKSKSAYRKTGTFDNGLKMLSTLIEAGVGVDLRDKDGKTALMYAAEHGELVRPLLKAGANPNLAGNLGQTALIQCSLRTRWNPKRMTCSLEDSGADTDKRDNNERNLLTWTPYARQRLDQNVEAVMRLLFVPGISIDHEDNEGDTALVCAERVGNNEIAGLIREGIQRREKMVKYVSRFDLN